MLGVKSIFSWSKALRVLERCLVILSESGDSVTGSELPVDDTTELEDSWRNSGCSREEEFDFNDRKGGAELGVDMGESAKEPSDDFNEGDVNRCGKSHDTGRSRERARTDGLILDLIDPHELFREWCS
ncbi:hypothetical protein OGAPHI_002793 [Ogataea philodendri]|uniref:Uncharacterized protein n=1 Tax=Ogataea philodendri TaxID=1378263 RepID=A0A9P8T690_9ASCO|nr:uncharacterized protein OGAPHI_002793 [Ogataea philodendri]KAH3667144.1 hypothetical protein OGAPHI_002793 [Ogataea philodendri]